ncbi:hypothetical protein BDZ91DRAFT_788417 [Kalaharituber pfeilii]|nr:hypothetical protein BDZ91DRAFT_788417 [Kalaharituber pfeilii]
MQFTKPLLALSLLFFTAALTAPSPNPTFQSPQNQNGNQHLPPTRDSDYRTPPFNPNGGRGGIPDTNSPDRKPKLPFRRPACRGDFRTCQKFWEKERQRELERSKPGHMRELPQPARKGHNDDNNNDGKKLDTRFGDAKQKLDTFRGNLTPEQLKQVEDLEKQISQEKGDRRKRKELIKNFEKMVGDLEKKIGNDTPAATSSIVTSTVMFTTTVTSTTPAASEKTPAPKA